MADPKIVVVDVDRTLAPTPSRSSDPPLFQEVMAAERGAFWTFWMVVGCVLVNRATWAQAAPIHAELRRRWPTPYSLAMADPDEVAALSAPLGFVRRRPKTVLALAAAWCAAGGAYSANHLMSYPGCGAYARDAWAIFVEGRRDVRPTDRRLRQYLARDRILGP